MIRTALTRLGMRLLSMADASLQWRTMDVPGLFHPDHRGVMTFRFRTMRMIPPAGQGSLDTLDHDGDDGYNFTHTCPGDPRCL